MKVNLAGYNVDADLLDEIKGNEELTPETISAANARISRSPKPVDQLRKDSRKEVEKARKSNKNIIYQMGHQSVAEHAVFNFDVIGISRLAIEALEHHRLLSFTEKSQRYITLDGDYVIPRELRNRKKLKKEFIDLLETQNKLYFKLNKTILNDLISKETKENQNPKYIKRNLEGKAKEDARYIISLATEGQLGMTANARNLEYVIQCESTHPLSEVRELSRNLLHLIQHIAPSLISHADAKSYEKRKGTPLDDKWFKEGRKDLAETTKQLKFGGYKTYEGVRLIDHNDIDLQVLTWLCKENSGCQSYADAENTIKLLGNARQDHYLKQCFKNLGKFNAMPRAFEAGWLTYEIALSSSAFAQLKRHRMASLFDGNPEVPRYDTKLGVTVPESVEEVKMQYEFMEVIEKTDELHYKIKKQVPENSQLAEYCLTNSHKRTVGLTLNMRELYAISRLREDEHAQWDIRNIVTKMVEQARFAAPRTSMFLAGKHQFDNMMEKIYSR